MGKREAKILRVVISGLMAFDGTAICGASDISKLLSPEDIAFGQQLFEAASAEDLDAALASVDADLLAAGADLEQAS